MRKLLASLSLAATAVSAAAPAAAQQTLLTIAGTGQASSYYAYHVAVSQLLEKELGYQATVQETGGALDNMRLLSEGRADWGQFAEPDFYERYKGIGPWEGKADPDFRVFWVVNPIVYFPVVREDAEVASLEDLTGKEFSGGARGSNTERMTMELLKLLDIEPEWYVGGYSDAVQAMKDRRIAGFMKSGSINAPDAAIMDIETSVPIDILSFTPEQIATIKETYPYYDFTEMEETPYDTGPVTVRSVFFIMGTTSGLSEDVAYNIVKTISENVDYQAEIYPGVKGADIPQMTIERAQAPLHAGVVKYFRELGLDIPERLIPPEAQ